MKLEVTVLCDVTVLSLSGEVIASEDQEKLRRTMGEVLGRCKGRLVVNLEGMEYLGSGAIAALVIAHVRLSKLGGRLKLACPTGRARHVLQVTRLDTLFSIHDSLDEAVASFAAE
jgi:anti-sigma B factor antagonist